MGENNRRRKGTMKKQKELLKLPSFNSSQDVVDFLMKPTIYIAETLTGVLSSGLSEYKLSAGRIVQSAIKARLLTQLGRELEHYQKKGRIKEDYFATNNAQSSLLELLKFIDSDIPDEEVFKAMKSIFFGVVSTDADEAQEHVGYQLLQVCKKLNSMDILVIRACYQVYLKNDERLSSIKSHGDWSKEVSQRIGFGLPELIGISDDKLVEMGILASRQHGDKSGIRAGREFRLTNLGMKLCEYITAWEDET